MAGRTFIAPERVSRDGLLVCFAGERMTLEEAVRRGLAEPEPAPEPAPEPGAAEARLAELMAMKAAELAELAEGLGAECPKGATKAVLAEAIMAAEA